MMCFMYLIVKFTNMGSQRLDTGENNKRVNVLIACDLDFVFTLFFFCFLKFSVLFIFIEASSSY